MYQGTVGCTHYEYIGLTIGISHRGTLGPGYILAYPLNVNPCKSHISKPVSRHSFHDLSTAPRICVDLRAQGLAGGSSAASWVLAREVGKHPENNRKNVY